MTKPAKRGFVATDERDFSGDSLVLLRRASEDMYYLLNRGYPVESSARFVGDHYRLSERQRLALARTISPRERIISRKSREVEDIQGETIYIDGFNVIIGLEIAFSGSMLFRCMDGAIRDLAGLHGSYKLIPQTDLAIKAMLKTLDSLGIGKAVIYLDKPISNSGRLKQKIFELAEDIGFELEVMTENAVDAILKTKPLVASGDAIILDECGQWFGLAERVIADHIGEYDYIDISPEI